MHKVAVVAVLFLVMSVIPARAELVFFASGPGISVKAVRSDGDRLVFELRGGGELVCDRALVRRVEPDEVDHPEDLQDIVEAIPPAPVSAAAEPMSGQYHDLIVASATKHGVDARVVSALIQVESAYHPLAVSPKGARGLMQVMPSTGRQYGALDLFDPQVNIDAGVRHLKALLARFELPLALAAYNAGQGAVERFGGIPPFRETQNYVTRILQILNHS